MQAGREMDALVADKVMGDRVLGEMHGEGDYWQENGTGDLQGSIPIPPYSTSIQAAWQVLEKVGVDGMALINDDNGKWAVVWDGMQPAEHEEGQPFWTSYIIEPSTPWADTVPLAICLAALKASGVEVA